MWVRCCCPDTPEEGIESHYRWLWATMWLLGTELRISEGTISGLNCWAISPAPEYINLKEREKLAEILLSLGLLVCGTMPRSIQGWWLNLELFLWWKSTIKPSPALNADYISVKTSPCKDEIFLFFFFFNNLFILCIWVHCRCLQTHQKRASDPITDGCEPPCGCWELNSGPLEEQSVLLTTEPSLQPRPYF